MLLALGHPPVVRTDHEQRDVDRADAREHVLEEAHMPWHVDEGDLGTARQRRESEAEVDGEPAPFSSANRSGSVPVSARTGVDLP